MTYFNPKLTDVVKRDSRYAYEAYDFVFHAIQHAQRLTGRESPREGETVQKRHHVSGQELLEGIRHLALLEFGALAKTVLAAWGVHTTDDWGNIVFNLIDGELMSKTNDDTRESFHDVYDFDQAFEYQITLDEAR
jgi:uncharacterized repeat protein (TIGR04138 family)